VVASRVLPMTDMSAAPNTMTVDEFLLWAEEQEGRWELHDGVAKRITPERATT
jgi:Uma2 family endonuclease